MATIQNVRALSNTPQKSFMWEVSITGLSTGSLSDLTVYARTVNIPVSSVEQVIIPFKSSRVQFAGRDMSDHTLQMTLWDSEAADVYGFFQEWMNLIRNPVTGAQTPKNIYTADTRITLMDSSGNNPTFYVDLTNSFPTELGELSLSYDSSEAVEINVTMSYDEKLFTKAST